MKQIVPIAVDTIFPHPDNPRKDLGDLTELADSIKTNGVLQNLTVIPGHTLSGLEATALMKMWVNGQIQLTDEEVAEVKLHKWSRDGYTVIIGHRRLAAAKLAEVTEVPCAVVELTQQEQIATMLAENVMRAELTAWEQAQGFQMMLDMGETVSTISKKTGFSQSTVRRRVKLLDLDPAKFKASEQRGAQLKDYAELDKIKDPELRNEVLGDMATANFQNSLKRAMETEKDREFVTDRVAEISQWAEELSADYDRKVWRYYASYYRHNWKKGDKMERPKDADSVKYAFVRYATNVTVLREKTEVKDVESPEDRAHREAEEAEERKGKELEAISERHRELREEFVRNFRVKDSHADLISQFACYAMTMTDGFAYGMDYRLAVALLGGGADADTPADELRETLNRTTEPPLYRLLVCAYAKIERKGNGYYKEAYDADAKMYHHEYKCCDNLDVLYSYLTELGYEMSDEEKAMQDASHEIFDR
ncbi:MAG: ParB/RepB/Spo0J family partition protein [Clostridiales bacterium]|nr:ParB/RepB/Spo0J family partition protein [Clostridiales bacterium]